MRTSWRVLVRAGVPCDGESCAPELGDLGRVVAATQDVIAHLDQLDERQRVSLLAWLSAWATSFAPSFGRAFGEGGGALLATVRATVEDGSRYLKLRRIAREKLLSVL